MQVIENDTHSRRDLLVCVACICAVVIAVFHQVGGFDFVMWDDDRMLFANPHVQGITAENLRWMFTDSSYNRLYMPLGWLFYALTVGIFGLVPGAHHLVNLALHVVNAVLVFGMVLEILRRVSGPGVTPRILRVVSCVSAIFWAIHPMRVEVVAWVGARVHGMAAIFALLSVWFYLCDSSGDAKSRMKGAGYWISVGCYALSIFTFPSALMLPGVLFILDVYVLGKGEERGKGWWWRAILGKVPFLMAAGILTGVSLWGRAHASITTLKTVGQFGLLERIAQAFYVWEHYVWLSIYPLYISPVYTRLATNFNPMDADFIVSGAVVAGVTVAGFIFRRSHPYLWAAWLCHLLILAPFLGLTEHPHYPSDRYSYLEGIIWGCMGGAGFVALWRWKKLERIRGMVGAMVCVIVLAMAALSSSQTSIWMNNETFFKSIITDLKSDPYRSTIEWRLANIYLGQSRPAEALLLLDDALQAKPEDINCWYAKGLTILQLAKGDASHADSVGLYVNAASCFDRVDSLFHSALALKQAGHSFAMAGKLDTAEDRFRRAIASEPNDNEARFLLADICHLDGKDKEALQELEDAVRLDPTLTATREQMVKSWSAAATTSAPASVGH